MARKKSIAHKKLTKRQRAQAEKNRIEGNDSSKGRRTKQRTKCPVQKTLQISPCPSSHATACPTDPLVRTSDARDPPSIQVLHSPLASHTENSDAGRTFRSTVALETQNNNGKPISPCPSSLATPCPTDPLGRISDARDPPPKQVVHSPLASQTAYSDAGRTFISSVALETQNNNGKPISPCPSSLATPCPTDPFVRISDARDPPPKQVVHSPLALQTANSDAGRTFRSSVALETQNNNGKPISPCPSSLATPCPTDPLVRISDARDPPSIQVVHSPLASQTANSDAGRTFRSSAALETQNNNGKPISPCPSSHATPCPTDPLVRTSDARDPPSIQVLRSPFASQTENSDAGRTFRSSVALETQNNNGKPISPCPSSHATPCPTDPLVRTSDARDPPEIQVLHSPFASQTVNSDAGCTFRSSALETQYNNGKPILYLGGQGFLPSRPAANGIGDILKSQYSDPWPSWKKIPISTRDFWFREFLRKFSICPPHYDWAKKNFEIRGAELMKNMLNEAQRSMNKPNWIKDDVWERLCEHWKSEELEKNSTQASDGGGFAGPLYTGSSFTTSQHGANMTKETGTLPTPLELFHRMHQSKDNRWVDIKEEYTRKLDQLTQRAFVEGNPPPNELDVWYDILRTKKEQIYELAMAGDSSSSTQWAKRQEFDELRKKMKEIRNGDTLQARVANIERLAEHNNALIQELMESMKMPSTTVVSEDEDEM